MIQSPLSILLLLLLRENQILVDADELIFQMKNQPSYPGLRALIEVLDHFNVDHLEAQVPVQAEIIKQLPTSFLAELKTDGNTILAVITKKDRSFQVLDEMGKRESLSAGSFLERFTGMVVAIDKRTADQITKPNGLRRP